MGQLERMLYSFDVQAFGLISHRFHQFDAVAKRVIDVGAAEAIERLIPNDRDTSLFALPDEFIQSLDEQSGMRFLRRSEVGFDAEMDLQLSLLKPDAAARGETGRFGFLGQSQDADIERSRRFLSIRRHCQLHVFDCVDFHFTHIFLGLLEADCLDGVSVEVLRRGGNDTG